MGWLIRAGGSGVHGDVDVGRPWFGHGHGTCRLDGSQISKKLGAKFLSPR